MATEETIPVCIEAGSGRGKVVFIQRGWSIAAVYRLVATKLTTGDDIECFSLLLAGSPLDRKKNVRDYDIQPHNRIIFVQQTRGGSGGFKLPPGVQLEFTKEQCCVLFDDNPRELRARMPCRCPISQEGVRMMSNMTMQVGQWEFQCPGCSRKLDFILMRDLLSSAMTAEELEVVKRQVDVNYLRHPLNDVQQCGTCGTYSQRDFSKTWYDNIHRAVCYTCSKRAHHTVEFCWYCGQQWSSGNSRSCGNASCQGPIPCLQILASCSTKTIGHVSGVPDTRACPRCGALIYHKADCKHMDCTVCACSFCFVCLKTKDAQGHWQCGEYNDPCPVAKRQTVIPEYLR